MTNRTWQRIDAYHWRCLPWTICKCFVDGCTLFVLSKDGESAATAYKDELEDAMQVAREIESGVAA